jgi:hypothetical protein
VALQSTLALIILFTHSLQQALENVGAILTLFAALAIVGLFRARILGREPKPSAISLVAASIYVVAAVCMLIFGLKDSGPLLIWVAVVSAAALVAYAGTRAMRPR